MQVPFNKPVYLDQHSEVIREAVLAGQISGNGPYVKKCENKLESLIGKPARLVTSATHAIEMMALLARLRPGDEVILPSFTFVSTASGFALRGAVLRFADNDDTGNLLIPEVERLMNSKTRAVMTMHYAGNSADMDRLAALCKQAGVPLFEDAAQSIGALYKGKPLGGIGALGCFSFHDTKNVTSGEGGALICGDDSFVDRAEILREKGTNRSQFMQGLVDKYTWVDLGSSYVMSDLNAAYLYPQLERLGVITNRRKEIYDRYAGELSAEFSRLDIQVLRTPSYNTPNYHLFGIIFPKAEMRSSFISFMKEHRVTCPFHYVSLHTSPFGATFYGTKKPESLPGCEKLSHCLVRLPLYYNMTASEQTYVVEKAREWLAKH